MNPLKKIPRRLAAACLLVVSSAAAHASPVKYAFLPGLDVTANLGWFVYDREAAALTDYSLTLAWNGATATFTPPTEQTFSASSTGFAFRDLVTGIPGDGPGGPGTQTFNVHLGAWEPGFAPVQVAFFDAPVSGGGHADLVGKMTGPFYFEGTLGGGIMALDDYFYPVGPVSAVPLPATFPALAMALGVLGVAARRSKPAK